MYLPDDRYASVVAFITGLSSASDGDMLAGFNTWVSDRVLGHSTTRVWWAVVYDSIPDSASRESQATVLLLDILEGFADSRLSTDG